MQQTARIYQHNTIDNQGRSHRLIAYFSNTTHQHSRLVIFQVILRTQLLKNENNCSRLTIVHYTVRFDYPHKLLLAERPFIEHRDHRLNTIYHKLKFLIPSQIRRGNYKSYHHYDNVNTFSWLPTHTSSTCANQ